MFTRLPQDQRWLWHKARLQDPSGNVLSLLWAGEARKSPPWRLLLCESDRQLRGGKIRTADIRSVSKVPVRRQRQQSLARHRHPMVDLPVRSSARPPVRRRRASSEVQRSAVRRAGQSQVSAPAAIGQRILTVCTQSAPAVPAQQAAQGRPLKCDLHKASDTAHQRSTRGPSAAPTAPVSTMPIVYQRATKAGEASGQASE